MTVDAAMLKLSQEVARYVIRTCLDVRRDGEQRGKSLTELLALSVTDKISRRELADQLKTINEEYARRLQQCCAAEFGGLPEHERLAAVHAVAGTLSATHLHDRALFDTNLDATKLTQSIRRQAPHAVRHAGLSEPAAALYDAMLAESCRTIVNAVQQLPSFGPRAAVETLRRMTESVGQQDRMAALLAELVASNKEPERDAEFEHQYRNAIATCLDGLHLYGVDKAPRTSVSVAYLSLDVTGDRPRQMAQRRRPPVHDDEWFTGRNAGTAPTGVPVEVALAEHNRILLRGEAGCGKTTLLQWLAVHCARGSFEGELAKWNDRVPFFIRLRRYADGPPPPEDFVAGEAPVLAGHAPVGWVRRQLTGRALLLVDGVDELSASRRPRVVRWLEQLIATYPELPIVVTSRTGAAGRSWLSGFGFGSVEVEPMRPAAIDEFCRRWHAAARDAGQRAPGTLPCDESELPRYEAALRRHFDARRDLRMLAETPLLCALLCALNLHRHTRLPPDRMTLYRDALDLLVDARDAHREVPASGQLPLDARSKIAILQHLALRFSLDGRAELGFDKALAYVSSAMERLHSVDVDARTVLEFLTDRGIVIRQPVLGRVDFVHRTFLEYLAAKEATEDHWLSQLIQRAHLDQWHGTVVMAAGHADLRQRTELLGQILDRAEQEPHSARRLRLLASACLDTAHAVDRTVIDRVDGALATLLPPRSRREARSLATAGDRVLRRLPPSLSDLQGLSAAAAAACVRTAALVNGSDGLNLLAEYSADDRFEVQRELAEAWAYFDAEGYARCVLADAPLVDGQIWVYRPEHVPLTRYLSRLTDLSVSLLHHDVADLNFLGDGTHLSHISINTTRSADLSPLRECTNLQSVSLHGLFTGNEILTSLPQLRALTMHDSRLHSIAFIADLPSLQALRLIQLIDLADISPIGSLEGLHNLNLGHCGMDPSPIVSRLARLRQLWLCDVLLANGLSGILPSTLTWLDVLDINTVDNLEPLADIANLETLWVRGCPVQDVSILARLSKLSDVALWGTEVVDLRPLAGLHRLQRLNLRDCAPELDLRQLTALSRRAAIWLTRGQQVRGLDAIRGRHRIKWC